MSLLCQLRRYKVNDTPVTMSTLCTQILVSNTILQQNKLVILREMTDLTTGTGNLILLENKKVLKKKRRRRKKGRKKKKRKKGKENYNVYHKDPHE